MSKILIVDDDKNIREALKLALIGEGYEFVEATQPHAALDQIAKHQPDMVLLDIHLENGTNGLDVLTGLRDQRAETPVIVLSGAASAAEAAKAMQLGALDFLEKPISAERITTTLRNALKIELGRQLQKQMTLPRVKSDLIGESQGIQDVIRMIGAFAKRDVKVLVTGESGTGKELVAQSIWQNSTRAQGPFVVINCASIPDNLVESELFGHVKGSFTGATANQIGKIELAHGGTLFMDEVGELTSGAQVKLLRFLESGEIQPVGAKKNRVCDVRVIAATSRDLAHEIRHGRFREDLYYRLNVARIEVPPLRARSGDAKLLFQNFVARLCQRHDQPPLTIESAALELIGGYGWPGNVRELRNIAERAVLLAERSVDAALVRSLLSGSVGGASSKASGDDALPSSLSDVVELREFRKKIEQLYVERVMSLCDRSVTKAAEVLGLDRSHLHTKLKEFGIK